MIPRWSRVQMFSYLTTSSSSGVWEVHYPAGRDVLLGVGVCVDPLQETLLLRRWKLVEDTCASLLG